MPPSTLQTLGLAAALLFAVGVTVVVLLPMDLYWGRAGATSARMSTAGRVGLAATLWLMLATIIVGVAGIAPAGPFAGGMLVAALTTMVVAAIDRRSERRRRAGPGDPQT